MVMTPCPLTLAKLDPGMLETVLPLAGIVENVTGSATRLSGKTDNVTVSLWELPATTVTLVLLSATFS
jgi:hypothetical protein